jgi:tetratricopeptide (TPR) repeat protein
MNPWGFLFDSDNRFALVCFVLLGILLLVAGSAGAGSLQTSLAVLLIFAIPLAALRIAGTAAALFLLAALAGCLAAFPTTMEGGAAIPVLLLNRLAYVGAPPVLVTLLLSQATRERMKLQPVHVIAPAVAMSLAVVVQIGLRLFGVEAGENELKMAVGFYAACYLALLVVALFFRTPAAAAPLMHGVTRAAELEEEGRYAMASRAYERDGKLDQAAETAERAGEWRRAGILFRRIGNDYKAAEMYARAEMWPDALDSYESAKDYKAAARLCLKLQQVDRAVALFEQAGSREDAIRALESVGRTPTPEQYRRAGLRQKAAEAFLAKGDWLRAAEVYEHDLLDTARAADLHLANGSMLHAGRLLESLGKTREAAEAYAKMPAGAVDAARLHMAAGRSNEAAQALAQMPQAELDKLEDEATLTVVARSMLEGGRVDEAIRLLQGLKRRGSTGGIVHLLLGKGLLGKGLTDLAEEELRVAVALPLEPADEMKAAYLLGRVLETGQKHDEALAIFHGILQKDLGYADVEVRYRKLKATAKVAPNATTTT